MLTETAARWLLVLHTILGVSAVGAATHLVVWMWRYRRGEFSRHRAVRRFAIIAFVLHALGFLVGNVAYPTYRVEVRAAYLENAGAVSRRADDHRAELAKLAAREGADAPEVAPVGETITRAGKAARWFDVKEHWIALGLFGSAALVMMLWLWHPEKHGPELVPVVLGLAVTVAMTLWIAGVIGVMTAAWRAI